MDIVTALGALLIFIFGITVGSFLNVCILRIPAGESIVTTPSHCPKCDARLRWFELIPIASWLALGGKCRSCKAPISPQYPLIEALNGVLWVIVFLRVGFAYLLPLGCLMTSALVALSVIDAQTQEIPPGINIFILVLGALRLFTDLGNWSTYLIGLFAVSVPLLILFYASGGRAIGGGDVKLMGAAGLFLGWRLALLAFATGCILGSMIHLARMKLRGAKSQLALGPYLAGGIFIAMLWGEALIHAYFALF